MVEATENVIANIGLESSDKEYENSDSVTDAAYEDIGSITDSYDEVHEDSFVFGTRAVE
jgi:hypothetical protein